MLPPADKGGIEDLPQKCVECMVTCHSIANVDGRYIGDPLDIEMFKATEWTMNDVEDNNTSQYVELATFSSIGNTCTSLTSF